MANQGKTIEQSPNSQTGELKAPVFTNGVPHCPHCGGTKFRIDYLEEVTRDFDASMGDGGWGDVEFYGSDFKGLDCGNCNEKLKLTPEFETFIQDNG